MKRMGGEVDEFEPNAIMTNGYIDNFFCCCSNIIDEVGLGYDYF
jgi:hypothetical protein